jgi:hypothetical protein
MGWVFDMELGVKRVPDELAPSKPEPVMFNGVECSLLAARYAAHRKAMASAAVPSEQREEASHAPGL